MIPDHDAIKWHGRLKQGLKAAGGILRSAVVFPLLLSVVFSLPRGLRAAGEVISVCLVGSGGAQQAAREADGFGALSDYLQSRALKCSIELVAPDGDAPGLASGLERAEAAVIWVHGQRLAHPERELLRKFSERGGGVVVVGAGEEAWYDWPQFGPLFLDAHFGGLFANGASMRVINLLPHAIFTGVDHFDTRQAMNRVELGPTAQVIMEGTVGEETVPMGWIRRIGVSRTVAFSCADRLLGGDRDFQVVLENSIRWAAGRRIPGAQTLVERTIMAGAIPGALAICFPGGPSICYDTVRGGIDYVWDGDYVDLHPWWTAKHGQPLRAFEARIWGSVFYRDKDLAPAMHVGTQSTQSDYHFRGYRIRNDGFPEIFYDVGDRRVTEDLAVLGDGNGVMRAFHVSAGTAPLWLRIDGHSGADISIEGATRDGDLVHFDSEAAGDFSMTIRKRATGNQ